MISPVAICKYTECCAATRHPRPTKNNIPAVKTFYIHLLMNRILSFLTAIILPAAAIAQPSVTFGLEGNGLSHTCGRVRVATQLSKIQWVAYGAVGTGGALKVGEQSFSSFNTIAGAGFNIIPGPKKDMNLYGGLSVEGLRHAYNAKNGGQPFVAYAVTAGPQMGINIALANHWMLNSEWGIRAGVRSGYIWRLVVGGQYLHRNTMLIYLPASIGLTYTFGKAGAQIKEEEQD